MSTKAERVELLREAEDIRRKIKSADDGQKAVLRKRYDEIDRRLGEPLSESQATSDEAKFPTDMHNSIRIPSSTSDGIRTLADLTIGASFLAVGYFMFAYDPTTPDTDTYNIGLLNFRLCGVVAACSLGLLAAILRPKQ